MFVNLATRWRFSSIIRLKIYLRGRQQKGPNPSNEILLLYLCVLYFTDANTKVLFLTLSEHVE